MDYFAPLAKTGDGAKRYDVSGGCLCAEHILTSPPPRPPLRCGRPSPLKAKGGGIRKSDLAPRAGRGEEGSAVVMASRKRGVARERGITARIGWADERIGSGVAVRSVERKRRDVD